ncbi:M23 family metallopeptidase [Streptomyces sp. NBC_01497]|uniref:M23 family metallopeptidase n=1 Tax=Streptomyces sp. NBC_01497 TaxID=2903885 RepID=UPI002E37AD34|nr:M23 family metallopeptidase [Streptomyces sp. NBC_01497]
MITAPLPLVVAVLLATGAPTATAAPPPPVASVPGPPPAASTFPPRAASVLLPAPAGPGPGRRPPPAAAALPAPADTAAVPGPAAGDARAWPVGTRPRVVRGWLPPSSAYGPGHRGVDLAARAGDPVRAAAAGRVSFAGRVAGRGVLSIALSGTGAPPLRITYEPVVPLMRKGDLVRAGQPVGRLAAGPFHCAADCLHWGLLRGTVYLDPLSLLPPDLLRPGPSRLLPLWGAAASSPDPAHTWDGVAPAHVPTGPAGTWARVAPAPAPTAREDPGRGLRTSRS